MSRKSVGNLTLPGFDVNLPICPGCKRPVPVLGQWAPDPSAAYLCRECTLRYPPPDAFTEADNKIGIGLRQEREHAEARALYHARSQVLYELAKGCMHSLDDVERDYLPCMQDDDLWMMTAYNVSGRGWQRDIEVNFIRTRQCRRCRNRLRYVVSQREQTAVWGAKLRGGEGTAYTTSLPVCARCGGVHDHKTLSGDAAAYCQKCDDELAVLSLWTNRGIFGADDDEFVLDRLLAAFPELFERGVLPDAWLMLRIENRTKE